jgi:hypothetical protein
MLMSTRRVFVNAPAGAMLALWLAVAGVSFGFAAVPALAEEGEATEAPAAEPGQQADAPAAEGEAPEAADAEAEAATSSPDRPRSRFVRPDPSDQDDALWDSNSRTQEALAAPAADGAIECIAGC